MTGMLRVPRSRGALSGVLLVLLGAWGGLVPFIGPTFHFAYTPDKAWVYNSGRLWLEILPGIAAVVGGLILLAASYRPLAWFGAWLAALSGAWFAVGTVLAPAWRNGSITAGAPVGGTARRAIEQLGFFTGLGLVIMLFAALALGRLSVVSVRDARLAERTAEAEAAAAEPDVPARDATSVTGTAPVVSTAATDTTTEADASSKPARTGRFSRWNPLGQRTETDGTTESTDPAEERATEGRTADEWAAADRTAADRAAANRAAEADPDTDPQPLAGTAASSD
jgi:hypothetical protein